MDILFSSAFFLLVAFLVTQFLDSKNSKTLILTASISILIGLIAIIYVSYFASSITIESPIEITVQNSTNQPLDIYAISFDQDLNDTINRIVFFDKKLSASKNSTFSIVSKQLGKFWIVAKNESNEIKYLKSIDHITSNVNLDITTDSSFDSVEAQTARELIFDRDIKQQVLSFAVWSNILLMALLLWSIFKLNKIRKRTTLKTELK